MFIYTKNIFRVNILFQFERIDEIFNNTKKWKEKRKTKEIKDGSPSHPL